MSSQPTNYRQFWHYYLREHSRILTRRIHYFGTGLAIIGIIMAVADWNGWYLLAAAVRHQDGRLSVSAPVEVICTPLCAGA